MSAPNLTVEALLPASLQGAVSEGTDRAVEQRVAERLRERDATLWAPPGTPEVADRLGWLDISERMRAHIEQIEAFAEEVREAGFGDVVLLGMGGSSLAPEVLRRCFAGSTERPRLHVLDSTDAAWIDSVQRSLEPQRSLFIVSSKSGGTIEPLSLLAHFSSLVADSRNFVAITDPGTGLERLARERGFRRVFHGDPHIGGRYSALSAFGIVPGALIRAGVRSLLEGAAAAWHTPLARGSAAARAGEGAGAGERLPAPVWLGAALAALARAGRDKLTFVIAATLPGLGLWLEQLVAESTGKRGTGILPVAEEPLGAPEEYGEDRVFAYLTDAQAPDPALDARLRALAAAGHPVLTVPTAGPRDLGRVFMLFELAVAVAGWGLEINPFDQPNVQQAKDATKRVLEQYEREGSLPAAADADANELRALLLDAAPPAYVAIMAYAQPTPQLDAAVAELRASVRSLTRATTTFGYGPRFLHSTGQFHKGGPRTGRFLQLLHDGPHDVPIEGAAYSFNTLKHAQALGDLSTLRELRLPAERLTLTGADPASALRALTASIKEPT